MPAVVRLSAFHRNLTRGPRIALHQRVAAEPTTRGRHPGCYSREYKCRHVNNPPSAVQLTHYLLLVPVPGVPDVIPNRVGSDATTARDARSSSLFDSTLAPSALATLVHPRRGGHHRSEGPDGWTPSPSLHITRSGRIRRSGMVAPRRSANAKVAFEWVASDRSAPRRSVK